MAFDWSQLLTPSAIVASAGGIGKLLINLLNHKSTANFEEQTKELKAAITEGNADLKGTLNGNTQALVAAIKGLAPKV